ncbi:MAG: SBBP repeat-containing protein [Chloroflexi bacterium]|nr:SBBP repeat-containing protein [Chloroflexota bacterium]
MNIKLSFVGANPHPRLEPFSRLDTHVSYFTGSDASQWRPDVPVWGGVRYADLYPGVDLELTGEAGQYRQRLVARPGADLSAVRLRVEGADSLALLPSPDGGRSETGLGPALSKVEVVRVTTTVGEYTLPLFEVSGLAAADVPTPTLTGDQITSPFAASAPDLQSAPSDPQASALLYSTYLGGSYYDYGYALAVGGSGNVYITGDTGSSNFPTTPGAFDTSMGGSDAFVTKLNAAGSGLVYSTFLGGSTNDYGNAIAVDGSGNAYVTGYTISSNFPTTPGAFDTTCNCVSYGEAFVTKLNAAGSGLVYSTYLGGSVYDSGQALAVDGSGNAYVTGKTSSSDFPTTPGALDTSSNGGTDAFVTKLNAGGNGLVYSTFVGGIWNDYGYAVAVDGGGNAYVTGNTNSIDFPATTGAFDTSQNGNADAFVTKLNADGSGLVYSTFLGGSNDDIGYSLAVDESGNAYVTGETASSDFPTTPGALDTSSNGGTDAFVTKLNAAGSGLVYSTFLGGSSNDRGKAIAVDSSGNAHVTGNTSSSDFPTTPGAFDTVLNGGDAFVTKLNAAGSGLVYSTFLGGSNSDYGYAIAVDGSGDAYVTGYATSTDFPTTPGAFDTGFNGDYNDAFVTKMAIPTDTGHLSPSSQAPQTSNSGDNNGFQTSPTNAYADDGLFAADMNSGTGRSSSCASPKRDRHQFYTYGIALPGSPTVRGIEVRLDAKVDNTTGTPKMCVELSWDGGATWTAAKKTPRLAKAAKTYLLGGSANTWGRVWSPTELGDSNFRVRITDIAGNTARDFYLDWVAVKIYYQP